MKVVKGSHGKFLLESVYNTIVCDASGQEIKFNTPDEAQKYSDDRPFLDQEEGMAADIMDDTLDWIGLVS